MKTQRRITHAWCVELGRTLSILAARQAFFEREAPRRRWNFLCSNPACHALEVRVTGVNYDSWPQEAERFQAAHFRANPHYAHAADCPWFAADEAVDEPARLPGESELAARSRLAKRKLSDYVDIFEPEREDEPAATSDAPTRPPMEAGTEIASAAPTRRPLQTSALRRSNSLERLVESYREAKASLDEAEFAALNLRVPVLGEIPLRAYFRRIAHAKPGDNARVLWGGALLVKRYGQGFRLKFYDRIEGKPVFLYVSRDSMASYRHRRYLDELLAQAATVKYFTVYALAPLLANDKQDAFSLEVSDPRRLALVLGPPKSEPGSSSVDDAAS